MVKSLERKWFVGGAFAFAMLAACSDSSDATAARPVDDAGASSDAASAADSAPIDGDAAAPDASAAADAAAPQDAAVTQDSGAVDGGRPADAVAPTDAAVSTDAAASTDAGNGLACGRYRVSDPGTGVATGPCPGTGCDGSGLVEDGRGGLIWLRFTYLPSNQRQTLAEANAYCASRGMRLPTLTQAQGIAGGTNTCTAAWPAGWRTWTSTTFGTSEAYVVAVGGLALRTGIIQSSSTLCVRSGGPQ
jgi:hypothetical protein